ncbi:unnamed protein product [Brassicogethes aeneus]|uniref:PR domain zinc finger protein 4 n=1 Tax=Brassicogethes aeneus TaxID=1431903 RepID=A0A9P0ASB8_BRAAE|nr:unnamed protein product [Brassicogethes aeneus]
MYLKYTKNNEIFKLALYDVIVYNHLKEDRTLANLSSLCLNKIMSKRPETNGNGIQVNKGVLVNNSEVNPQDNSFLDVVVGPLNAKRWTSLKDAFSCKTNQHFVTKLLDLAQEHLSKNGVEPPTIKRHNKSPKKKSKKSKMEIVNDASKINEKEKNNGISHVNINTEMDNNPLNLNSEPNSIKYENLERNNDIRPIIEKQIKKECKKKEPEIPIKSVEPNVNSKSSDSKLQTCIHCKTHHEEETCPLIYPKYIISDSLSQNEWQSKYKQLYDDPTTPNIKTEKDGEHPNEDMKIENSFSKLSLPDCLYLDDTNTDHGLGVFIRYQISSFTQMGPLIGNLIKEVDISEDSSMRFIWEMSASDTEANTKPTYFNTEDLEGSNWIRFIRPAPSREEKNVSVIFKEDKLYFITVNDLKVGDELLYWQDNSNNSKKKLEKTSCGGCNMTFSHPIYYRTHCSVFHDIRFSLTIRKYHCKICGEAVLGKENIMKHAAELHNGQGAYQCQFCKKYFLRLNYLEMHRTYGCSANPHRSRPLCDFCGRKFCQPQKLKVHIKRMHSDFSVVLKEFQCKICMKILGSPVAVQRHLKEVHQKQLDGTCSCSKCGKHFQNKSNLKIHMLTHSGIKPFKCSTGNCNAAFTTKQCLQFHYKKVHNYTEENMPKIERSIDYSFEAYSGSRKQQQQEAEYNKNSEEEQKNSDVDIDEDSLDIKSIDDPPALQSPLVMDDQSQPESCSPPHLETYNIPPPTSNLKVLTKGSKKWIADEPIQLSKSDLYHLDHKTRDDVNNISLHDDFYDRKKLSTLNDYGRSQEASNASLLVEAALDSVCSEPNIDIDVGTSPNCADSLVNNLYTLAPHENLNEYNTNMCINDSRDINLISPSVNDHISVTDELNDELRQSQNIGIDYSNFQQEDFSPASSPSAHERSSFVRNYINTLSPHNYNHGKISPASSPPRYDFGHTVTNEHLSSDDSNGMAAQNLSIHNSKNGLQLDLSIYKSPYKFESQDYLRKELRMKFDTEISRKIQMQNIDNVSKIYNALDSDDVENMTQHELANNMQELEENVKNSDNHDRSKYTDELPSDIRGKFDLDLEMRLKQYEGIDSEILRQRNSTYESTPSEVDFRSKNYDLIDSMELRNKSYDNIDNEFRTERNFEPLLLNSTELQGLDMSARSFHNYSNINRYHHLYPEVDRVDLRLNYSPPPPSYTHADILRVVSLDLTPPGRHSVDLSLRSHPLHTRGLLGEPNPHRLIDQGRILPSELSSTRLLSDSGPRILSDHTTNRILSSNEQLSSNHLINTESNRLLSDESRILTDQPRLLEQSRLLGESRILQPSASNDTVSPVPGFSGYSVSQGPYHPTPIPARPHVNSPTPTPYHPYPSYY